MLPSTHRSCQWILCSCRLRQSPKQAVNIRQDAWACLDCELKRQVFAEHEVLLVLLQTFWDVWHTSILYLGQGTWNHAPCFPQAASLLPHPVTVIEALSHACLQSLALFNFNVGFRWFKLHLQRKRAQRNCPGIPFEYLPSSSLKPCKNSH